MSRLSDDATRPRRVDELAEHVASQLRRLDRAISELDEGDEYALDDIVIALRSLAGQGKGNHTITELARTVTELPGLHPVTSPVEEDATLTFATGALPVSDRDAMASTHHAPRSLGGLMNLRCLTVTAPEDHEQRTYTWDQLVSKVANKLGPIHSDSEVPVAFDEIKRFETAGQSSLTHALRNLAVVVARHGHAVLVAAGSEAQSSSQPKHRIPAIGAMWVGAMQVRENRKRGGSHVTVEFDANVPPPAPGERIQYPTASVPTRMAPAPDDDKVEVGRNAPCPCGSGEKYKRCCGS